MTTEANVQKEIVEMLIAMDSTAADALEEVVTYLVNNPGVPEPHSTNIANIVRVAFDKRTAITGRNLEARVNHAMLSVVKH